MEIQQPRKRDRRSKNQTFYPLPASFSEADPYEYSSDSDESDDASLDSDGFKKTLVSEISFVTSGMWNERM